MAFDSIVRFLERSPLTGELGSKLEHNGQLYLNGVPRLPKGLVTSGLAKAMGKNLLVVCATLEEAGRWAAQLEAMGWNTVHFYPTSETSPYEPFDPELEMVWGQLSVISHPSLGGNQESPSNFAIVATEKALQPHLPPPEVLKSYCMHLKLGVEKAAKALDKELAKLGYERVNLVETEGQWSRRGDIVDVFPVSAELPVRLEWFGDELDRIREFDVSSQRSLDKLEEVVLTPTSFTPMIATGLAEEGQVIGEKYQGIIAQYVTPEELEKWQEGIYPEGMRRFLPLAFPQPASLLNYLPENILVAVDETEQCLAHSARWLHHVEEQWQDLAQEEKLPKTHQPWEDCLAEAMKFPRLYLSEIADETDGGLNLSSRAIPTSPHQFAKLAGILRGKKDIYGGMNLGKFATWLVSAQPSRSVALLQEHDCSAQFVPNPKDFPAIDKLHNQYTAVGVKYSGLAELEGFILPTFRIVIVTDREFYGQRNLATPGYVRKRRRATSKQVDVNKLRPGDYVVHKSHGVGKFIKLESLEMREYVVIKYEDGLLRIPADSLDMLSRLPKTGKKRPELNKMTGKAWQKTKNRVRKAVKKLAVDLLELYAKRSQQEGFAYPEDMPWQLEMEDSFPYQPTPDQLKATQDVKRDLESDRPMDRLVCGDVGFGKTEVAIRAIFKVVTTGNKQVAFLAPTTILTQQHYHTLKERFAPYPINIGLMNRFRTASEKKEIMARLAKGELDIVVGTHQLLSKSVDFKNLGMLVIDEEQRFGVNQKEKIKTLKTQVDVLTLSATPIPRTLYMSLSGIREMSLITTPPPSRRPIKTHLSSHNLDVIRSAIRNELDRGGQVFYVVPRIEGIGEVAMKIQEMIPSARISVAHGQMPEGELESTMLTFNNGEADILVCTTIVESGLDIPRVNTIIIEDSQKFGLAQLYQLKGRVGRAGIQAHAWLLYPDKSKLTETARKRLRALQELTQLGSGYQLAMRDMEIRGVGNLLGAEQSGQMDIIGFDLYMEMLQEAIREIQGQEIPQVDEAKIDLKVTAFIPSDYITDMEQKMDAYSQVAKASNSEELAQIAASWRDRYGELPSTVNHLLRIVELKHLAKSLGFSRVCPGKQHVILETPMEEPAWKLLQENLPEHLKTRFVYAPKKVTVRGLGVTKPAKQLECLIEWLGKMKGALPEVL